MNKLLFLFVIILTIALVAESLAAENDVIIIEISASQIDSELALPNREISPESAVHIEQMTLSKAPPTAERGQLASPVELPYELQVLDSTDKVIYFQPFDFTRHIEVPLPHPDSPIEESTPLRVKLENPRALLTIPLLPNGRSARIVGDKITEPVPIPRLQPESTPPENTSSASPPPSQPGTFNILIMASGYSPAEMGNFVTRADEIRNRIFATPPFNSSTANIAISIYENSADLGCYTGCFNIDRLMCCTGSSVLTAANNSGIPHDEIIVVHNTSTYAGGGYRDYGSYQTSNLSSYSMVYDGYWSAQMALHEFGHSFGNLCDEYSYGVEGYDYYDCANCRPSCSEWDDVSAGCTLACDARSDYYRPEDSLMLDLAIASFNAPSIYHSLIPRMGYFTGIIPGDINGDGFLSLLDIIIGLQLLSGDQSTGYSTNVDINEDGVIGMEDLIYVLYQLYRGSQQVF